MNSVQVFKSSLAKNLSQPSRIFGLNNHHQSKNRVTQQQYQLPAELTYRCRTCQRKAEYNAGPKAVPQQRGRGFRSIIPMLLFCKIQQSKLPGFSNATERAIQAVLSCGSEAKLPTTHGPRRALYLWRRWPRWTESFLLYQSGNVVNRTAINSHSHENTFDLWQQPVLQSPSYSPGAAPTPSTRGDTPLQQTQ